VTDEDLYGRSVATALACWQELARGATGAALHRLPGVAAAVFPHGPERTVYNNAILERHLTPAARVEALDAMEAAYADSGVELFAAWVHESDRAMQRAIEARGYSLSETTRAMGMTLDEIRLSRPVLTLGSLEWSDYVRVFGLPDGLLDGADHSAFRVVVARLGGEDVATALAFDWSGDCGIYNVLTLEHVRRRGLGAAVAALVGYEARDRGCRTATLQSTPMAERMYASVGFRDLGRILEYTPPS
jgi:GNAT superfamily N-acetyltransferase